MARKNEDTVRIEILEGTNCGGERCNVGDVVEASLRDARLLTTIKKAKKTDKKVGKAKVAKGAAPAPNDGTVVEPPAPNDGTVVEPPAPTPAPPGGLNTQTGPK